MIASASRVLIVHAGGSKTGTTSLQNFFDLHVDRLNEAGIAYYNRVGVRSPYSPTSGNGWPLLELMNAADPDEAAFDALLDAYLGAGATGLLSTERLERTAADGWRLLLARARAKGIGIRVVYFVRDPVPYFVSRYDQAIKRHGETRDFLPWFEEEPWWHFEFLRRVEAFRGEIDLALFHYPEGGGDTVATVARLLGVEAGADGGGRKYDANRSLTGRERRILRYLNAAYGSEPAISLSTFLLERHPHVVPEKMRDPAFVRAVERRFRAACEWINERYFGAPTLRIDDDPPPRTPAAASGAEDEAFERMLVDWAQDRAGGPGENPERSKRA